MRLITVILLAALLLVLWPDLWLRTSVSKRHLEILKALPNLLDLLTLSVEAGKDFLSALKDILMKRKKDALTEEFMRALHEIQLGKKRQAALREMSERVRQPELMSVIGAIVQADEMGVSIGQLLKIQSDQLRMKRFALAEKLADVKNSGKSSACFLIGSSFGIAPRIKAKADVRTLDVSLPRWGKVAAEG